LQLNKSDLEKITSLNDSVLKSYLGYTFKAGPLVTKYLLPSFTDVSSKIKEINAFIEEKQTFTKQEENRTNFIVFLKDIILNLRTENVDGVKILLNEKFNIRQIAFIIDVVLTNTYSIIVFLRGILYVFNLLNVVSIPSEIINTIYSVLGGYEITAAWTAIFMFLAFHAYKNPESSNRVNAYDRNDVEVMLKQDEIIHQMIQGSSFESILDKFIKTTRSAKGVNKGTLSYNSLEAYERLYFAFTESVADFDIFDQEDKCKHCDFSACVEPTLPFHVCRRME
jgi:hypothetical protein